MPQNSLTLDSAVVNTKRSKDLVVFCISYWVKTAICWSLCVMTIQNELYFCLSVSFKRSIGAILLIVSYSNYDLDSTWHIFYNKLLKQATLFHWKHPSFKISGGQSAKVSKQKNECWRWLAPLRKRSSIRQINIIFFLYSRSRKVSCSIPSLVEYFCYKNVPIKGY